MIKHTHQPLEKEYKKRSDSINHNEPNSTELDCGQLFCGPASGRSQLLPPSHIPPMLLLWSLSKQAHWSHTSNFILLPIETEEAHSRIQGISFLLISLILYVGKARRRFFFPLSLKYWGGKANCRRIVLSYLHLNYHFTWNTDAHPNSLNTGKKPPFHTPPQHRQHRCLYSSRKHSVQTTYK